MCLAYDFCELFRIWVFHINFAKEKKKNFYYNLDDKMFFCLLVRAKILERIFKMNDSGLKTCIAKFILYFSKTKKHR